MSTQNENITEEEIKQAMKLVMQHDCPYTKSMTGHYVGIGMIGTFWILLIAQLWGVYPMPWTVVFSPLWAPPLLLFWFAFFKAFIMETIRVWKIKR